NGTGSGTVTSSPVGIDCGSDCTESFADGTPVTLTAKAADGSTFAGWSGACSADPCSVIMNEDRSVTATFNLAPVNHPPDAVDDSLTTDQDTAGQVNVLANDSDPDPGDTLTVTGSTNGAHGTVSCTAAGVCTYTPAAGFSGSDSFTYTISDAHGGSDTANVQVTVRGIRKSTSTTYTGGTSVQYSDPVTLSGTLVDTSVSPNVGILGKQLDFTLGTQSKSAGPTAA